MDKNFEVLRHGNKYLTRGGDVVTVEHRGVEFIGHLYSFRGIENGVYYTERGETLAGETSPSMFGLVYNLLDDDDGEMFVIKEVTLKLSKGKKQWLRTLKI